MDLVRGRRTLLRGDLDNPVIGRGRHIYAIGGSAANGKSLLLAKKMM